MDMATLMIIDEPTRLRDLLSSILRMRGYAVLECDGGHDAFRPSAGEHNPAALSQEGAELPGEGQALGARLTGAHDADHRPARISQGTCR